MSALADIALNPRHVRFTPKADIAERDRHVRFVPKADIVLLYSTIWSARANKDWGTDKPSAFLNAAIMLLYIQARLDWKNSNRKRTMKRSVLEGLLILSLIFGFSMQAWAQQPDIGKLEYESSCASCHGADGKGAGPVAAALKTKPADLTTLAKANNGVFPFGRIYDVIDGREEIRAHGARDMPIWGFRFSPAPMPGVSPVAPYFLDPLYDREPVIRSRILAVIDYLYRIQVK